jgi:hypothetical protein
MAKTVLLGPMGPNVEYVWLSNVPLSWNNPRQLASISVLNVILPTYIIMYEWRNVYRISVPYTLHSIVQCTPVCLSVYFTEDSRILESDCMVDEILVTCRTPSDLLASIP